MIITGIDPGPEKSALVEFDGAKIVKSVYVDNDALLLWTHSLLPGAAKLVAIEMPEARGGGQPVSQALIDTAAWAGRFDHYHAAMLFYPRDVRIALCGVSSCTRAHVNQALEDQFAKSMHPDERALCASISKSAAWHPAIGSSKYPGPLYSIAHPGEAGISTHLWDALAVAVAGFERARSEEARKQIQGGGGR